VRKKIWEKKGVEENLGKWKKRRELIPTQWSMESGPAGCSVRGHRNGKNGMGLDKEGQKIVVARTIEQEIGRVGSGERNASAAKKRLVSKTVKVTKREFKGEERKKSNRLKGCKGTMEKKPTDIH